MDAIDLLQDDALNLPWALGGEGIESGLNSRFERFFSACGRLETGGDVATRVQGALAGSRRLAEALVQTIRYVIDGEVDAAQRLIGFALSGVNEAIQQLVVCPNMDIAMRRMYRICLNLNAPVERHRLFHVPFHRRDIISAARYSIAGTPCLYLGGSVFTCWRELGCPGLRGAGVAVLRPVPGCQIRALSLGFRHVLLAAALNAGDVGSETVAAAITLWPLMASCSIQRSEFGTVPSGVYAVPQMMMRWVHDQYDIDGIRYFSTRVPEHLKSPAAASSYAFPSKTNGSFGHCSVLRARFQMSDVVHVYEDVDLPYDGFDGESPGDLVPRVTSAFRAAYERIDVAEPYTIYW